MGIGYETAYDESKIYICTHEYSAKIMNECASELFYVCFKALFQHSGGKTFTI